MHSHRLRPYRQDQKEEHLFFFFFSHRLRVHPRGPHSSRLCPLSWWNLGVGQLRSPRSNKIWNPSSGVVALMGSGSRWALYTPGHSLLPWVFLLGVHPSKDSGGTLRYKEEAFGKSSSLAHHGVDRRGLSPLCLGATRTVCSVTIWQAVNAYDSTWLNEDKVDRKAGKQLVLTMPLL